MHKNTSTGMKLSPNGSYYGLMTSDGFVKVAKISNPDKFIFEEKRHRLPVTCLGFRYDNVEDSDYVISGSADYTYNIIYFKGSL